MSDDKKGWRKLDIVFIRHGESANNCTYELARQKVRTLSSLSLSSTSTTTETETSIETEKEAELESQRKRDRECLEEKLLEQEIRALHCPDTALSARGETQARRLGDYIAAGGLSDIVSRPADWRMCSSPMLRCLLTSREISRGFGAVMAVSEKTGSPSMEVHVIPFLFESDGCYRNLPGEDTAGEPGMIAEEVEARFPNFKCAVGMENGWYTLPKRESKKEFLERVKKVVAWLWEIQSQTPEERGFNEGIIISAHGNLIQATIALLVGAKDMMLTHCNTAFAHVQLWSDRQRQNLIPVIMATNRTEHLRSDSQLLTGSAIFEDHWIQEYLET